MHKQEIEMVFRFASITFNVSNGKSTVNKGATFNQMTDIHAHIVTFIESGQKKKG